MVTETLLTCLPSDDAQIAEKTPSAQPFVQRVKTLPVVRAGPNSTKKPPAPQTFTRLDCFNEQEWAVYRAAYDIQYGSIKRQPLINELACSDCELMFQLTNMIYGRCWPANEAMTPIGRLYNGESSENTAE